MSIGKERNILETHFFSSPRKEKEKKLISFPGAILLRNFETFFLFSKDVREPLNGNIT